MSLSLQIVSLLCRRYATDDSSAASDIRSDNSVSYKSWEIDRYIVLWLCLNSDL